MDLSQLGPETDFDRMARTLVEQLAILHRLTKPVKKLHDLHQEITQQLDSGYDPASAMREYLAERHPNGKLAQLVEASLAYAIVAARKDDTETGSGWASLCQAYYWGGMASTQMNVQRGADGRAERFAPINKLIFDLAHERCPEGKWASLIDIWAAIQTDVHNAAVEVSPGDDSFDAKAAFDRVAKKHRKAFQALIASPIKPGRPSKARVTS